MTKTILHKYIVSFILTFVILSCSTEKNTFVTRNFHNLNAHYNVYFNGNEAMKEGLEKIEIQMEEDYTKILPVFKESMPGSESVVTGNMNTAVEKGMKLIKLHSITKAPESSRKQNNPRKRKEIKPEYNKWVDDAYLMIGKAYLYQKEYIRAASTFTQIIRKYKDDPVKYEAYLWLMRTYSESERYTEAQELMESLEGNDQFPKDLEGELAINAADLHLKQQQYDEAIQYLNIGIKKIRGNKRKTRYTFILAQLYQETENNNKALETYHQVIRRRPDYRMLFNAQINMASVFSGDGNSAVLRKELNKMKKKKRNEPFLDQIYFALGNILFNEGQIDEAIDLYKKSAAVSVSNKHQRALSCLTLAELFFERKNYIPSGMYYDSAMVEIDENYPNYKAIADKHYNLSRLVTNLLTVETQDSLQALAALPPTELDRKISNWIAEEMERIARDSVMNTDVGNDYDLAYGRSTSNRLRVGNSGNSWYFYNPSTVSYGKKEFGRIWGTRKNEDNWRRKNKSISMTDENGEPVADLEELIEEKEQRSDDKTTKEYYLQDLPSNDSLMAVSHDMIRDALFNAGTIYKNDFNDLERSIECFNELNRRYPKNTYELPSMFYLWDLYTGIEREDSAAIFKEKVLSLYPNSNYAKYLNDPNFFIQEEIKRDSLNNLYSLAYTAYKNNSGKEALSYIAKAKKMNPDTLLMPKLRFIELITNNKNADNKVFSDSLQAYVKQYPYAETAALVKKVLDLVKDEKLADYQTMVNTGYINEVIKNLELLPQNDSTAQQNISKWDSDTELLHYFVIALPIDEEIDVNRLKFDIANYNIDHYTTLDFDIETENLNNETQLIVIRNFNNKDMALIYFLSIIRKPEVFKTLAGIKFLNFIISNNNYREMLGEHSYNDYLRFFVKNYSTYTSGEFLDEELESPEDLIAKLNKEDDDFKEQGEFVVVDTDDGSYVAPEAEAQIYAASYDVPHIFMVLIKEPRFSTGLLMRDLVRYNTDNYRSQRLRVVPVNMKEVTLLTATQFENAYEASEYQKAINSSSNLFNSLGETKYTTYIISTDNLSKLRETNAVEEWEEFFKTNYVYRKPTPPAPVKEKVNDNREETETNTSQAIKQEENKQEEQLETKTEALNTEIAPDKAEILPDTINDSSAINTSQIDTIQIEEQAGTAILETDGNYSGPFTYSGDGPYNLIYILPQSGSSKALLTTYVARFNAVKYRSFGLEMKTEDFDEYRSVVIISGLGDRTKADVYMQEVNADSRVVMSLRNVNNRNYLISNDNLKVLRESKDIQEYQKFYDAYFATE